MAIKTSKKSTALTPEVIDIRPENPDVALATSNGTAIAGFVQGMREFFKTATSLELAAKSRLERMQRVTLPTTKEEDDVLIAEIRGATADEKAIGDHWTITKVASRFHKLVVSGRDRGVNYASQAKTLGNSLHNRYVDAERRRVAEETERRRRAEEARQAQERAAEVARMEQAALDAEAKTEALSEREDLFVTYVVQGRPHAAAAIAAGFKDGDKAALRLLGLVKVVNAIDARRQAAEIRQQAAAVQSAPLNVQVEKVQTQFSTAGRTSYSAEVVDPEAFMAALLDPRLRVQLGIPADIATFSQPKMNENARALKEQINRWPGVRLVTKTGVV